MEIQHSDVNRVLGWRLRSHRLALGWSLKDVVSWVNRRGGRLTISTLSRAERGFAEFWLGDGLAVASAIGLPVTELQEMVRGLAGAPHPPDDRAIDELVGLGRKERQTGNHERALPYFEAALRRADAEPALLPTNDELAAILVDLADAYRRNVRFGLANAAAARAARLPGISESARLSAAIAQIGTAYMSGDFMAANAYSEYVARRLGGLPRGVEAYGLGMIGSNAYKQDEWKAAIEPLEIASRLYRVHSLPNPWARVTGVLGLCYARTGDRERGRNLLDRSLDVALSNEFIDDAIFILCNLGRLEALAGMHAAARADFESSAALARKYGQSRNLFESWFECFKLSRRLGDRAEVERLAIVLTRLSRRLTDAFPAVAEFVAIRRELNGERCA